MKIAGNSTKFREKCEKSKDPEIDLIDGGLL